MSNPYRQHQDRIQALVRSKVNEYLPFTPAEPHYLGDPSYLMNHVLVSGGMVMEDELDKEILNMLKEQTDVPVEDL